MFSAWKRIDFLYNWSSEKRERNEALKVLHGETRRVINLRRSLIKTDADEIAIQPDRKNVDDADDDDDDEVPVFGAKQRRPFLDSLLIAQRNTGLLTDANIQEEVDTFMFEVNE